MSKIFAVGIGPGSFDVMTPQARGAIDISDAIVGYDKYIEIVKDLIEGKKIFSSGMMKEVERCKKAFELAETGMTVSVVSSGDAGIYGMAGLLFEMEDKLKTGIEIEVVPGVSALNAAAAILGAPLMNDFAVISLSDLLTPWEVIQKRAEKLAEGDFVIVIYNPKSGGRPDNLLHIRDILLRHYPPETPVGIVRNAFREEESRVITNLQNMMSHEIDMFSTVIIGNSTTIAHNGRIYNKRGYVKKENF